MDVDSLMERYRNDSMFNRFTDQIVDLIMSEIFSIKDIDDAFSLAIIIINENAGRQSDKTSPSLKPKIS